MGIFDALTTAVSGLQAQSFALQNISGNIANSQTIGYKETDTLFQDLVSSAALGEQTAGGVFAGSAASNGVQGTIQNETVSTDMAIDGNGWFVVAQPSGSAGGTQQSFSGVNYYTRRGDFQMNQNGYLVNGAGYYLMGIPLNPATGAATSSSPQVLQFNNNFLPAQATTQINYQANLPSTPSSQPFTLSDYTVNPLASGSGTVVGNDASTFAAQSLDGGSITTYDSEGNAVNVQLRWAETATSSGGNTWQLFYQIQHQCNRHPSRLAERRNVVHVQFQRPIDVADGYDFGAAEPDRERRHGRQRDAELWHRRADAIRNVHRQCTGERHHPERLHRRPDAVALGGQPGPDRRRVLERPNRRSGQRHAGDVQRPGFAAAAQRRGLRGHARFRHCRSTRRPAKSSAVRSRLRTSTSPPSSAS